MCSKIRKNIRAKGEKRLKKLVLIDGNSIMNRAFYGIMGSKMLTTKDGKYTNGIFEDSNRYAQILKNIQMQCMVF